MIAIIAERLTPSQDSAGKFELLPDFELMGKPYRDLLAVEYRKIGAREVFWLPLTGASTTAEHQSEAPYKIIDREGLSSTAITPGEALLIADMRLWPSEDLHDAFDSQRMPSGLTLLSLPVKNEPYCEIIEPAGKQGEWKVRRKYQQAPEPADPLPVAFIVNSRNLTGNLFDLIGWIFESGHNSSETLAFDKIEKHFRSLRSTATWVNSLENYLEIVERRLRSSGGIQQPGTTMLQAGVWASSGARIDSDCSITGPVFIGRNSRIGSGTRIMGPAHIGDDCNVGTGAFIGESVMQAGAEIGNCARIWHSVIGSGMKVEEARDLSFAWLDDTATSESAPGISRVVLPEVQDYRSVVLSEEHSTHPRSHRFTAAAKRVIDIIGALIGLTLTLPLYPFIALAIVIDNFGPVFYVDRRLTRGGKEFGCLKFRSMIANASKLQAKLPNQVDGPQFHMEDDPRLTRVGRFLRKTNLDEVPQFWNVLLGHMSLVGPRPSPDREIQYCPAWREARLSVKAGLTGLWQTKRSSDRSQGDFHEWIYYDTDYVRNCSVGSDLKVLFETCKQMIRKII